MTEEKIVQAVDDCLKRCLSSQAKLICVAEFVLNLRDEHQWEPAIADEVGRRVLRLIRERPADS
jgi:hypothetical protein